MKQLHQVIVSIKGSENKSWSIGIRKGEHFITCCHWFLGRHWNNRNKVLSQSINKQSLLQGMNCSNPDNLYIMGKVYESNSFA
jgi:hypothetical protein